MNLAEVSIKNPLLSTIAILLALFSGWYAYQEMPRFEDPEFTIRSAIVITQYPGASPEEVAREVSEPLESAIQQMQEVEFINTKSSAGVSEITVDIKFEFSKTKEDLQIIWAKLRNKIDDAISSLPKEAQTPIVNDDFGDVYGLSYLITGEGYSYAELRAYAKQLQKEVLQVKGVAKVQLLGEQQEAIFIEISRENSAALGVSIQKLYDILANQNSVVSAGSVSIGDQRISIDPSGAIDSVDAIENLLIANASDGKIIYLKDIAKVYRGYKTPASKFVRYNGKAAIVFGVSNVSGGNIVKIGNAVDLKMQQAESRRPIGIQVQEYYHQGKIVEESVDAFVLNVIAALVIVIISLLVFMGRHSAIVMAFILLITVAATLATMFFANIPIHRISLGALIIALGMMVDNAVVITEAILVGVQNGQKKLTIAKQIVTQTKWPLLAGTMVGVIAFAPIGFAPGSTAEYTGDLFWVVMIALLFSWLFAMTITPLACYWLFPDKIEKKQKDNTESEGTFYVRYKQLMRWALNARYLVIAIVVILFSFSIWGAQFMTKGFFPQSTSPQLVVDYWLPQSTNIERTRNDMVEIEGFLAELNGVNAIQTLIGGGGLRFMLTYSSESSNSAYGQFLIRVDLN